MYISNGYVCGGIPEEPLKIREVKVLQDMMLILTFSTGERRLFDASILDGKVFEPLKNPEIFSEAIIEQVLLPGWMEK